MKPLKYRILSHTADLRLEVFGKTLEELFENAAEAIADILSPRVKGKKLKVKSELRENIKVKSVNLSILLVDFLNEILAKSHINKRAYSVQRLVLRENSLEAELVSYPVQEFKEDIKAVTYHEVDIKQSEKEKTKSGKFWHTKLVLDI